MICLIAAVLVLMLVAPVLASPLVNMEFKEAPLVDVFQILGRSGLERTSGPILQGNVSFVLRDLTVQEALDLVAPTGYRYKLGKYLGSRRLKSACGRGLALMILLLLRLSMLMLCAQDLLRMIVPQVRAMLMKRDSS